jgi:hypothetical protein
MGPFGALIFLEGGLMKLHKNGYKRNLLRFKMDYEGLQEMPDGKPMDWLRKPWNVHHYTDMFVESCSEAPFLMGHWWAVYFPVSIIIMGVLFGKCYT